MILKLKPTNFLPHLSKVIFQQVLIEKKMYGVVTVESVPKFFRGDVNGLNAFYKNFIHALSGGKRKE